MNTNEKTTVAGVGARSVDTLLAAFALLLVAASGYAQSSQPQLSAVSPRLYVLDGGVLASDPTRYRLSVDEVAETALSIAAYLIVHPQGILLWDAGAIADSERISDGTGQVQRVVRYDGDERFVTLAPALLTQLATAGFAPADVTHLALSHYHWDHTANANNFADALWLVPAAERDAMFAAEPPGGTRPATYAALAAGQVLIVSEDEHDVFGDGSVVLMQTAGHTPGHMVLYVELANLGRIVLSGDLFHYPEERSLDRLPLFDFDQDRTAGSRLAVEALIARTGAQLWIGHDLVHHRQLQLAPAYYD
jgi:glyoxylase-like metal-dependent hydrolase (beta-lactamase superfamily II)